MENSINNQENQPQPPIDTVPTSAVLDGTPKKRNYLPWLLGILVLVVVLAASFLILTSKSKPTLTDSLIQPSVSPEQTTVADTSIDMSSWKTYSNANLGITLRYPSSWTINTDGLSTKVTIKSSQIDRSPGIEITSRDIQDYVSLSRWLAEVDKDCEEARQLSEKTGGPTDCINYKVLGERKINQYVLPKILWNCCGNGPTIRYFIEGSDKIYFVDLFQDWEKFNLNTSGDYDEDGSALAITYQQILSTFKFIDTTTDKINLTLPTGWTKSIEQAISPFDETEKYERIILVKGNYRIEIGDRVGGGRASCDMEEPAPSILNNPSLSSVVKRTNPKNSSEATNLQVCSNLGFNDDSDYGTKIGFIKYFLPANWDKTVLKEMDSIVESITLVK